MVKVEFFAASAYVESIREKTILARQAKEQNGYVIGSVPLGYTKAEVLGANGQRSHVEYRIDVDQAATVTRVFEHAASGKGLLAIVHAFHEAGVVNPDGTSWSTSGVREILKRETYRGVLVTGKTKWERKGGAKKKVRCPESEWRRVEAPELRIISEELWQAARASIGQRRDTYLRSHDGPAPGQAGVGRGVEVPALLVLALRPLRCQAGGRVADEQAHQGTVARMSATRGARAARRAASGWRCRWMTSTRELSGRSRTTC